jgi:hypothetical protein
MVSYSDRRAQSKGIWEESAEDSFWTENLQFIMGQTCMLHKGDK